MTTQKYYETIKGLDELHLRRFSDGVVYHLPAPSNFTFDPGRNERQIMGRMQGLMREVHSFITGENPVFSLEYPINSPELMFMKLGFEGVQETQDIYSVEAYELGDGGIGDSITLPTGFTELQISYKNDMHESVLLTETTEYTIVGDVVTFDAALVDARETVSVTYKKSATGFALSDTKLLDHELRARVLSDRNRLGFVYAPKIRLSYTDAGIDFNGETIGLTLKAYTPLGKCKPVEIIWTDEIVTCS